MKIAISLNFKKIVKRVALGALPVAVIAAAAITYVSYQPKDDLPSETEEVGNRNRQVYTICKDNLVVPLTVNYQEDEEDVLKEIEYLSSLMLKSSSLVNGDYIGVLPRGTTLKEASLTDGTLTLNYSESFIDYEASKENRILEALTWTFTQFNEVDNVVLALEDDILTHMPVNNLPLPQSLNRSIGINNHLFNTGTSNMSSVNVFYQKELNNKVTYIPTTINVAKQNTKTDEILTGLNKIIPVSAPLKRATLLKNNEIITISDIDIEQNINLTLGVSSLIDEVTVDNKIFDYVVMTLQANQLAVNDVNVLIDGELMRVNGYENTSDAVAGLAYNTIKI